MGQSAFHLFRWTEKYVLDARNFLGSVKIKSLKADVQIWEVANIFSSYTLALK